jgi:hypothetical protein
MANDKEVFDAMRIATLSGQREWTGRAGTREAIRRNGLVIDPISGYFARTSGSTAAATLI